MPLLVSLLLLASGCAEDASVAPRQTADGSTTHPRRVTVAAASDLKFALDELIAEFHQKHPGYEIRVTYGASGNLFAQLANRAPFDIYFSADIAYPRRLIDQGQAAPESEFVYGVGSLVVWVPIGSPINVARLGVEALLDPAARKIAIANPRHAPYGRAAEAAMKSLGVLEQVQDRLVLGENVAQAAHFVESGAADVGLIARSLAMSPAMKDKGHYWTVPLDAYPKLEQGSVILKWAADRDATEAFHAFVAGPRGQATLERFGFVRPGG